MRDGEVLMVLRASTGRRLLGVGALAGLGLMLVYLALVQLPPAGWLFFMLGTGALLLWLAKRMWRATGGQLELTREGLRSSDGTMIAPLADVAAIERGVFAFKPSNGFLIRLHGKAPKAWQPGLWWRLGRRVGVGGVTASSQAKVMAELMSELATARAADGQRK
ncbi:hypothetical protein SAMN05443999_10927 [Roseovarius azorensis]|uniref:Uncharacterized protein n=1 Tax=Roseovarius azorensis TaxID=1287727 RepID=A0A1H7TUL0_9RHOB|nr:hypothetical protein [Roseovarius azorensis]SEL87607.1 hypothetical protein SAMN05443999_10927 [Roseovarius azorensis]